jgi:methyl-accepting chemotaxis protein
MMDSARDKQLQHWIGLFSGRVDQRYVSRAENIGHVHARIGLEPTWYIGGYATVLEQIIARTINRSLVGRLVGGRIGRDMGSLVKLALLDMDIAVSAYFKAEEASRLAVIEKLGAALAQVAGGDFSVRLEGLPDSFAKIEEDFEGMRGSVADTLAAVASAAAAIHNGAQEIREASDDLATRTVQQAASLEETAAAMEQLTRGVNQSSDGIAQVSAAIKGAQTEALEGGIVVKKAVSAMDEIQSSTGEISSIVELIDGIAFQTNLLALNAGVEAARAGDAGKGFAVVANEVRALAQRSAQSANDIKSLIKRSSDQVVGGVSMVGGTGQAFERISNEITEITTLASDISELSSVQASGLVLINTSVREMDKMTQQNAAMVEESTAASHSLAGQSEALAQLVGRFKFERAVSASYISESALPARRAA